MCGRYTLATPAELISDHFGLNEPPTVTARFNIAPSQEALIIGLRADGRRAAGLASWGLLSAARGRSSRPRRLINARIETVSDLPSFRDGFARRRCLVPANGFFEWKTQAGAKWPVFFSLRERPVFAFAGIWNPSPSADEPPCFAILTTRPNAAVEPVHDRMPVILRTDLYNAWLAKEPVSPGTLEQVRTPAPAEIMRSWMVSRLVNSPANDSPECVEPVEPG